jgi:adenomatosis polyposis coli protein
LYFLNLLFLFQVTSSVLRNLSWHADSASRAALRDSNAVTQLTSAAIKSKKESTLKATLSALWNLSAHSAPNKVSMIIITKYKLQIASQYDVQEDKG